MWIEVIPLNLKALSALVVSFALRTWSGGLAAAGLA
jgi:hypothetical protein